MYCKTRVDESQRTRHDPKQDLDFFNANPFGLTLTPSTFKASKSTHSTTLTMDAHFKMPFLHQLAILLLTLTSTTSMTFMTTGYPNFVQIGTYQSSILNYGEAGMYQCMEVDGSTTFQNFSLPNNEVAYGRATLIDNSPVGVDFFRTININCQKSFSNDFGDPQTSSTANGYQSNFEDSCGDEFIGGGASGCAAAQPLLRNNLESSSSIIYSVAWSLALLGLMIVVLDFEYSSFVVDVDSDEKPQLNGSNNLYC